MSSGIKCPECGGSDWTDIKYLKNGYVEFLTEGKCILCGFSIDAGYLYNQICENTRDLLDASDENLRYKHDKSLQEVTLRDYPEFTKVLKKALDLTKDEEEELVDSINWKLVEIYRELAWYARTVDETYDWCNLSTKYQGVALRTEVGTGVYEKNFIQLAWSKSDLDWWLEKCELLKEVLKITKQLERVSPDSEYFAEDNLLVGEASYNYAMALGNDPEVKKILRDAINKYESAIACSNLYGFKPFYYSFFNKGICIVFSHLKIGKIYEFMSKHRQAYAHYVLAEQSASYLRDEIFGPTFKKGTAEYRQKLEDKLSGDSIAEAKELARKYLESVEHKTWEHIADESSIKCRDRLLVILKELETKLPRHNFEEFQFSIDDLQISFTKTRIFVEQQEREIFRKLFGSYPKRGKKEWLDKLFTKLKDSDESYAVTILNILYNFSSHFSHYNVNVPELEDLELLYIALTRYMDWYLLFSKK